MVKDSQVALNAEQMANLAFRKSQLLAKRQKKKLFHSKNPLLVSKKERVVKKVIAAKNAKASAPTPGNDVDLLMRETSNKIEKIRKHTKFLVSLDKYAIRDRVEALRAYLADSSEGKAHSGRRDDIVDLVITISKVLAKVTVKPVKVPVVHPVHSPENKGVTALICKDNDKRIDTLKEFVKTNRINLFTYKRVVELFKDDHKAKELLKTWDNIFCDDNLYDKLRKRYFKLFMKRRKLPYPVDVGNFQATFKDLINNVYMTKSQGPVFILPAARLSMSNKDAVKNIINLVYESIPHILVDSEKNTQVLHISLRCGDSKQLEIYKNDHVVKQGPV